MVEQLWAPWRLAYVAGEKPAGCVLCAKPGSGDDDQALIVARSEHCYAVLNLYPYNNGHLMVVPYRHVGDFTELTPEESADCQELLGRAVRALRKAMRPDGFNIGLNLGSAAGAGIEQHLHWHLVPRWNGDTNFMPVLADIKVMPQHLETTRELLQEAFAAEGVPAAEHRTGETRRGGSGTASDTTTTRLSNDDEEHPDA